MLVKFGPNNYVNIAQIDYMFIREGSIVLKNPGRLGTETVLPLEGSFSFYIVGEFTSLIIEDEIRYKGLDSLSAQLNRILKKQFR